jgi:hypothetical protein
MALLDFFLGREEDQLAKPAANEDKDLSIHVELCARRYKTLADRIVSQQRLLWVILLITIVSNWETFKEIVALVLK